MLTIAQASSQQQRRSDRSEYAELADLLRTNQANERAQVREGVLAVARREVTETEVDAMFAVLSNDVFLLLTDERRVRQTRRHQPYAHRAQRPAPRPGPRSRTRGRVGGAGRCWPDVTRVSEWSHECRSVSWLGANHGGLGARSAAERARQLLRLGPGDIHRATDHFGQAT
jgi:hypothetical protein